MTLLKFDGFEGYSSISDIKNSGGIVGNLSGYGWSLQTGRNSGKCMRFKATNIYSGIINLNFPSIENTRIGIMGFAMKHENRFLSTSLTNPTFDFGDGSLSSKVFGYLDDSGNFTVGVARSNAVNPVTVKLNLGQWYYVEAKLKIHDTAGIAQIRINEELVYDYSGDTKYTFSGTVISAGRLISDYNTSDPNQNVQFDDVYIADDQGTENNDFLGDVRIDAIHPNGAGNHTDFTPSAGSNYECIDETGFDDSDYVEGANAAEKDSYTYQDVPTDLDDSGIIGLQIRQNCRRTATADNIKIDPFIRTGSTDYSQTEQDLPDSFYEIQGDIILEDPSDSNPWTQAKINACEFGVEVG